MGVTTLTPKRITIGINPRAAQNTTRQASTRLSRSSFLLAEARNATIPQQMATHTGATVQSKSAIFGPRSDTWDPLVRNMYSKVGTDGRKATVKAESAITSGRPSSLRLTRATAKKQITRAGRIPANNG